MGIDKLKPYFIGYYNGCRIYVDIMKGDKL